MTINDVTIDNEDFRFKLFRLNVFSTYLSYFNYQNSLCKRKSMKQDYSRIFGIPAYVVYT